MMSAAQAGSESRSRMMPSQAQKCGEVLPNSFIRPLRCGRTKSGFPGGDKSLRAPLDWTLGTHTFRRTLLQRRHKLLSALRNVSAMLTRECVWRLVAEARETTIFGRRWRPTCECSLTARSCSAIRRQAADRFRKNRGLRGSASSKECSFRPLRPNVSCARSSVEKLGCARYVPVETAGGWRVALVDQSCRLLSLPLRRGRSSAARWRQRWPESFDHIFEVADGHLSFPRNAAEGLLERLRSGGYERPSLRTPFRSDRCDRAGRYRCSASSARFNSHHFAGRPGCHPVWRRRSCL